MYEIEIRKFIPNENTFYIRVGFCPTQHLFVWDSVGGLLSCWAFVWMGFCPNGILSATNFDIKTQCDSVIQSRFHNSKALKQIGMSMTETKAQYRKQHHKM